MVNVLPSFLAAPLDEYVSPARSARCLLLAVLDRALRDLHPSAGHVARANAIAWFIFEGDPAREDPRFTYKQLADMLDFSAEQRAYIQRKIDAAKFGEDFVLVSGLEIEPMHRHRAWV
jgi:hypothetical protein